MTVSVTQEQMRQNVFHHTLTVPPVFWKAYKKAASIDLDSNGGLGVYPNDIRASSLVTVVNDQWKTWEQK